MEFIVVVRIDEADTSLPSSKDSNPFSFKPGGLLRSQMILFNNGEALSKVLGFVIPVIAEVKCGMKLVEGDILVEDNVMPNSTWKGVLDRLPLNKINNLVASFVRGEKLSEMECFSKVRIKADCGEVSKVWHSSNDGRSSCRTRSKNVSERREYMFSAPSWCISAHYFALKAIQVAVLAASTGVMVGLLGSPATWWLKPVDEEVMLAPQEGRAADGWVAVEELASLPCRSPKLGFGRSGDVGT
jgi:hypothetical protein